MIKYVHTNKQGSIAYYYREKSHYDAAMAALQQYPTGTLKLMEMADFAVDRSTNQLLKNRSALLEDLLDAHLQPVTMLKSVMVSSNGPSTS